MYNVAALRNKKYLGIAIFFTLFHFLISLIHREPHIDDYWLGEYAYWFSKLNFVKSELLRGYENYEVKLLVYHKFFIILGGLIIKSLWFNVYFLKTVSLIFLSASIYMMWKIMQEWDDITQKGTLFLLYLFLLFCEPHIFEYGFVFRPEIMLMFWGLCAYYYLDKAIKHHSNLYTLLGGFFSGIAFLTHLNGISFLLAGGLVLLLHKKFSTLLLYSTVAILTCSLYFWDITNYTDWSLFLQQFRNDPALEEGDFKISTYFMHLIKEHERFFHSPSEIFISILFFLSLYYNRSYLKKHQSIFLKYFGIAIIALAILCYGKTAKYMILYIPFMCMVIAIALYRISDHFNKKMLLHKAILLFFILFIGASYIINFQKFTWNTLNSFLQGRESPILVERKLHLAPGTKILGSVRYTYQFNGNYQLQWLHVYDIFLQKGIYKKEAFPILKMAESFGNQYIFLDKEYIEKFQLKDMEIINSNYRLIYQSANLWILKHMNNLE